MVAPVWQHALHRLLVFGSDGHYWKSLAYTYACYSMSIVLSTILNDALVEYLGAHQSPGSCRRFWCPDVVTSQRWIISGRGARR